MKAELGTLEPGHGWRSEWTEGVVLLKCPELDLALCYVRGRKGGKPYSASLRNRVTVTVLPEPPFPVPGELLERHGITG